MTKKRTNWVEAKWHCFCDANYQLFLAAAVGIHERTHLSVDMLSPLVFPKA